MFCEKCGTRVDDGQPFCPTCGNRLGAPEAPAAPANQAPLAYSAPAAPRPAKASPSVGGLLDKYTGMSTLEKIFFPIVLGLWVLCFILSLLHTMKHFSYLQWSPLLGSIAIALFTLAITFILLDYFDTFSFKWLWIFNLAAAAVVLIVFVISWIDSESKLTAGGWIFFFLQLGVVGCSVMQMLEHLKK